ncbi:iron ABC transporter [Marinitenerispora sediminis]|uniref:Iron ABC transporter n=1 Tax=Marinitenerispora sediminis TaxID=1931232 RepID=A0A368TBF8_9ACTN|nr:iron ABC transporter [Marinitenerispora sediminis]RCV48689.1 iron ABC transporter [Marinitenerispora sediminis]RCV62184.1 iron ABC transporter [Marinitenerispora sediminis]
MLAAGCVAALCLGRPVIAPAALPQALTDPDSLTGVVVREIRLPRMLLGLCAGVALGSAGLLLQEALRNPLAVPELLGVSAGSAAVVAAVTVFGLPVAAAAVPGLALAGGIAGGGVCLLVARRAGNAAAMLLTGAAVAAALNGVVYAITSMADQFQLGLVFRYVLGSLVGAGWPELAMMAPWLVVAAPALLCCLPLLGVLGLGDDAAASLGLHPDRARLAVLAVAAVLVSVVVAACGPISWVGFLAPMLARALLPSATPRARLGWAALLGGTITVLADLAARTAFHPLELPLGAFTGTVGIVGGLLLLRARAIAGSG